VRGFISMIDEDWKLEIGGWKLEVRDWRLKIGKTS
jgi:hypothetical protein